MRSLDDLRCGRVISDSSASACPDRTSDVPSEENRSTEQKAAESEVDSFRKDLGPFVVVTSYFRAGQSPLLGPAATTDPSASPLGVFSFSSIALKFLCRRPPLVR